MTAPTFSRYSGSPLQTQRALRVPRASAIIRPQLLTGTAGDVLLYALVSVGFLRASVGGDLYLSEVLVAGLATFSLLVGAATNFSIWHRRLMNALGIWAAAQLLADIINQRPLGDVLKGQARVLFAAAALFVFSSLIGGSYRRVLVAVSGLLTSSMVGYVVQPTTFERGQPWKFGVGFALTLGICLLLARLPIAKNPRLLGAVLVALACVHVILSARSLGLITGVTGLIVISAGRTRQRKRRGLSKVKIALAILLLAVALPYGSFFYAKAASSGALGAAAEAKYNSQGHGRLGILIGGRPEFVTGLVAVARHPWFGFGSYAPLDGDLSGQAVATLNGLGYTVLQPPSDGLESRIPTHSLILQAWVEGGLLALPFWLCVLAVILGSFGRALKGSPQAAVVLLGVNLLWDVFFSPYGGDRVVGVPLTLVLLLAARTREEPAAWGRASE